ncbi:hypothetical protein PoB_005858500 [Plakobranchus ocellatus]|uniref:Uncharacterized protein n=1 Tax=Plakobranchus ocellatus TaxID=259542 RepID=A0AAV4CGV9_9GAST|nr:hypothetical protein PoB_005858500 [Plakobranchus ocellatus]
MCTQEVKLSGRDRKFGKTSECAHKRFNSQHGIGESATLPNVQTSCQLLTRGKQFGKISEYAHKRSNSQHRKGSFARLPNVHTRRPSLNTG